MQGHAHIWLMPGLDPGIQPEVPLALPTRAALDCHATTLRRVENHTFLP